jgi:hypothetical protein
LRSASPQYTYNIVRGGTAIVKPAVKMIGRWLKMLV